MKKIPLLLISLGFAGLLSAQSRPVFNMSFNHLALTVKDVDRSAEFYKKVLSLKEVKNGAGVKTMRWLSLGGIMELHLISMGNKDLPIDTAIHFALATRNFDAFLTKMKEMNIHFENADGKPGSFNTRADGVRQIYFQDPDGYWIEVNNIGEKKKSK